MLRMSRTTREVLQRHLFLRQQGKLDMDLDEDYAEDAVLITGYGIFHHRESIRASANILYQQLHGARYMYRTQLIYGEMAFLEWTAENGIMRVKDGADSYHIRDGHILVQTIHYTLESV